MAKSSAEEMAAIKSRCAQTAQKGVECKSATQAFKIKAAKDAENSRKQIANAIYENKQAE